MSTVSRSEELRQMSSDSILDAYENRRMRFLDYGRKRKGSERWSALILTTRQIASLRKEVQWTDVYSNSFLELLLFCSTMVLWMSGIVMLAFGFYLVFSQYGWAVMTGSTMYWLGMMLQTTSALSVLTAAGVTTTLLSPDTGTFKRALVALTFLIISAALLISEIIVCSLSKKSQQVVPQNFHTSILNRLANETLSREELLIARSKGYECRSWENDRCNELYIKVTETYINFLIGSASVTLALISLASPILILVHRTAVHKITRVQPTAETSNLSTQENEG